MPVWMCEANLLYPNIFGDPKYVYENVIEQFIGFQSLINNLQTITNCKLFTDSCANGCTAPVFEGAHKLGVYSP
jgi:hypothetical protein